MKKIMISACLAGQRVRYDGRRIPVANEWIDSLLKENGLIPVCPELLGGLDMPRPAAQIIHGTGVDVIKGEARVVDTEGHDVTLSFLKGAEQTLSIALKNHIDLAVFKEKSPSCGVHRIYDGTFSGTQIPGSGVTVALLKQHGIRIFSEHDLDQARAIYNVGI